jgi:DNA mismatch endonuclease (patch repair protein)
MDTLNPQERSERMARVRCKDTKPEMLVRRLVHSMGFRYRLHNRELPGKPDLVFARRHKIIFVHGCFWHRHGKDCALTRWPKSKLDFWRPKLEENRKRDRKNFRFLRASGWDILVLWECELKDRESVTKKISEFLLKCEDAEVS